MATITKGEYDALPESLKAEFEADGDNYSLRKEDVEGLKKSKAEILEEKKRIQKERDDLAKFKADHESAQSAAEEERLKAAGEFAKIEDRLKAKIAEITQAKQDRENELLGKVKIERLKNELITNGVLADRAKYALADIADQVELVESENGFAFKVKGGIGDANEFTQLLDGLKSTSAFLFDGQAPAGSGASGSDFKNGTGAKTITRAQWEAMAPADSAKFFADGGAITD